MEAPAALTVTDLQPFVRHLDERFDRVDTRLEQVATRLTHVETRLDHLDTRLDHLDSRFGAIDIRLNQLDSRLQSFVLPGRPGRDTLLAWLVAGVALLLSLVALLRS